MTEEQAASTDQADAPVTDPNGPGSFFNQMMAGDPAAQPGASAIQTEVGKDMFQVEASEIEAMEGEQPPAEPGEGQQSDSPTDTKEASESDSSTDTEQSDDQKPPPYDQDPKWKAARAAEKRLQDLMEKHGIDDPEDLESLLEEGTTLKEKLGDRDAERLLQDSDELRKAKEQWDEQQRLEAEENETPEDTIRRLKMANEQLANNLKQQSADQKAYEDSLEVLDNFNNSVTKMVESSGLEGPEAEMLSLTLGLNNPINNIDIADPKAVKQTANETIKRFSEAVKAIKQSAIDSYSQGREVIPKVTKTVTTEAPKSVQKTKVPANASVDETFDIAKGELLEILEKGSPD